MAKPQRLRARWALPITSPPIENAEIVFQDARILEVRPATGPASDTVDLGEAILMPGLVNVHTHLDYTLMRGLLEDIAFFPWIRELTARKSALDEADWIASATLGAAEAIQGGVTTIGDCTDSGAALLGAKTLGLRGVIYQEVFGIDSSATVENILRELDYKVQALKWQATGTRLQVGISPHAPYTVREELFRALATYAASKNLKVCIHASESQAEAQLLRTGNGPIAEMFQRRGIEWRTPGQTPVCYLNDLGILSDRALLVHGVQLAMQDREVVRRSGAAWAYCPKSNAKLGAGIAPLGLLRQCFDPESPRLGLGSDSVASNNTMDLFEEMRFGVLLQRAARRTHVALTAREAVEMATIGGARALGMSSEVGSLEPGKTADFTAVSINGLHAMPCYDPYSALVYASSARDVVGTWIDGERLYNAGSGQSLISADIRNRFISAVEKMRSWSPST